MGKHIEFCNDLFNRSRFETLEVPVGHTVIGGKNPIRLQSMTTTDTMDTEKSVDESIRMIDAGCELVRLTAPSIKEAENLAEIKRRLQEKGYDQPLVADIHFTPNAAEVAAKYVEKIRVNPGNYADKKKFEEHDYTDDGYQQELIRIEEKFTPLVLLCKKLGRAMRIGTNHGSLSDRILSRFGDTPEGMVASAMEFIEICRKNDYYQLVISMKASNTIVMVHAYRLLVKTMKEKGMNYPLHLGVTEAGDGEDGRIKSAVGIGALLEDGLGDTIRVSLTEDPEFEIPVAAKLAQKYENILINQLNYTSNQKLDYYHYNKRKTNTINNIGGSNHSIVFGDLSKKNNIVETNLFGLGYSYSKTLDKWTIFDQAIDYLYTGKQEITFNIPGTLRIVTDYDSWQKHQNPTIIPLCTLEESSKMVGGKEYFLQLDLDQTIDVSTLPTEHVTYIITTKEKQKTQKIRRFQHELAKYNNTTPVILHLEYTTEDVEQFQIEASADAGIHFIDGFGDGIWITANHASAVINSLSFGILQATRTRISKTEYISCPSCGRTLFDLQSTTAKIRSRTSHLKGLKIGIMGCIVNGPGEMADADYGYVGTGQGKITLYKEKQVVRKNVPEEEAVDALIDLLKENGDWIEPNC